jgi:hypothetical protein
MNISELLSEKTLETKLSVPQFFNLKKEEDIKRVSELLESKAIVSISDDYEEQMKELFQVQNPTLVYAPGFNEAWEKHLETEKSKAPLHEHGLWVHFPWNGSLTHILEDEDFQQVRTARNKNLINAEEQAKFYNSTVGIAGLSVGNSVLLSIVLQGGARHIKMADNDVLALSNTNRVRISIENLGVKKTEATARQIYSINPYATIEIFDDGLTNENIDRFFEGLDIVLDEMDNIAMKYRMREYAKKLKLPLLMATDNGDNGVVDIERYDLDPETPFFHGRAGEVTYDELTKLDKFGIGKMATRIVGAENVTLRMQESLMEMGKTIVSWPQLGGAAILNGPAVAYCVRKILNGQPVENNRALVSLDALFVPGYNSLEQTEHRAQIADTFRKMFGLE